MEPVEASDHDSSGVPCRQSCSEQVHHGERARGRSRTPSRDYILAAWEQLAVPQEELEIIAGETKLLNIVLKFFWNMWKISNTVDAKCSLFSTRDNFLLADLSLAGKRTHYLAFPVRSCS